MPRERGHVAPGFHATGRRISSLRQPGEPMMNQVWRGLAHVAGQGRATRRTGGCGSFAVQWRRR